MNKISNLCFKTQMLGLLLVAAMGCQTAPMIAEQGSLNRVPNGGLQASEPEMALVRRGLARPALQSTATPIPESDPIGTQVAQTVSAIQTNTVAAQDIETRVAATLAAARTQTPTPSRPLVLFAGEPGAVQLAERALCPQGIDTLSSRQAEQADIVFFVVGARDGPMPQTVAQFECMKGRTLQRVAIFLTDVELQPDPELQELLLIEVRDLMTARFMSQAETEALPVFKDNDPDLLNQIRAFINQPPTLIQIR